MLTIIPNPKAMDYDKLIDFLNKRKNIELNRPELLELLWLGGHYIHPLDQLEFKEEKYSENNTIPCTVQELVANDILDLSQYMFLTHEYTDDGFDMEIVLHGIFTTLEDAGDPEHDNIVAVVPGDYINYTAYKEVLDDDPWDEYLDYLDD